MSYRLLVCFSSLFLLLVALGCGQKTSSTVAPADAAKGGDNITLDQIAKERANDARKRWEHDQGFIVLGEDGKWLETNYKDTPKQGGKPHEFVEVRRTADFIELRDPLRALTVRLMETAFEVHWDAQKDKPFIKLYQGVWKK